MNKWMCACVCVPAAAGQAVVLKAKDQMAKKKKEMI